MSEAVLRLLELREGRNELRLSIAPGDVSLSALRLLKNVTVELVVNKNGEKLLLNGTVLFEAEFCCAWCSECFSKVFHEKIEQEYLPRGAGPAIPPFELTSAELHRELYTGETIDITPVVRDTILLAVPLAPVCRDDCRGLCPVCGTNLNYNQCACVREEVSAWKQALAKLKQKE